MGGVKTFTLGDVNDATNSRLWRTMSLLGLGANSCSRMHHEIIQGKHLPIICTEVNAFTLGNLDDASRGHMHD
ncbi:hypothetical protein Y032_0224g2707 [Ancylostoma ceylanicum]|uniref:Uncharacterized protein n=1 Tax=Ancylostoma ceylanicum TaxID=53326 RepID=A0A016SI60_9BILA|nr:hypothetical protein Y032_0224g2707 [Ancylostoma ceylanicum]